MDNLLPYFVSGNIVTGFGRGSKELGFPTANYSENVTESLPETFKCGVYFGWAKVDNGPVYPMVMSVGFNPYYDNTKKSMETHILHTFDGDLYGKLLKVCIAGYLREEKNFDSLDLLILAIKKDISDAVQELNKPKNATLQSNEHFMLVKL